MLEITQMAKKYLDTIEFPIEPPEGEAPYQGVCRSYKFSLDDDFDYSDNNAYMKPLIGINNLNDIFVKYFELDGIDSSKTKYKFALRPYGRSVKRIIEAKNKRYASYSVTFVVGETHYINDMYNDFKYNVDLYKYYLIGCMIGFAPKVNNYSHGCNALDEVVVHIQHIIGKKLYD